MAKLNITFYLADILFEWFAFDHTGKAVANSTQAKQLNPNNKTGGQPYSDTSLALLSLFVWSKAYFKGTNISYDPLPHPICRRVKTEIRQSYQTVPPTSRMALKSAPQVILTIGAPSWLIN